MDIIEQIARAMKPELFEGGPDEARGPAVRYERDFARKMARAAHSVIAGKVAELVEAAYREAWHEGYATGDAGGSYSAVENDWLGSDAAALAPYPERRSE